MSLDPLASQVRIRKLGVCEYQPVCDDMTAFTATRNDHTRDEIWALEHPRVFTQGQAGKAEHVLMPGDIPVIKASRGGQVTYHGPGQLVVYFMLNLTRKGLGSRALVSALENAVVSALAHFGIQAEPRTDAPGVYVQARKIASLGLRIKKGCSFHGLALNIDMDLEPFRRINPCGYANMQMTQMVDETTQPVTFDGVCDVLLTCLQTELAYEHIYTE